MLLLLALLVLAAPDTLDVPLYDRVDRALDSLRVEHDLPGLAVAVLEDGHVAFARGYGWADLEGGRPVTAATPFRIASLTKPLAASLLLRQVEHGRLDLDRPFADYAEGHDRWCQIFTSPEVLEQEPVLRDLVADWRCRNERDRLTVRHYLTHTAQGEPGAAYRYNGFLYGQLFRVAEGVGGRPFADLLQDSLFTPLGMTRTLPSQADSTRPDVLADLALPYQTSTGRPERADWPRPLGANAGAGVVSTVLDLARFDAALDHGEVIGSETRDASTTPSRSSVTGERLPYGLGWFVQDLGGEPAVWHYGWQPGAYSGLWLRLPRRGLTLILLSNGEELSSGFGLGEGDVERSPFARAFLDVVRSFGRLRTGPRGR
ncbi:serine hydrolase domain-containing protein [Rubrivirga sp.]|uniref:serine hydrolase domain-containing protein n=1 Tax=Rubrivirga sp. TaxID=1885344 RepID=UPI003C78C4DA